MLSFSVLIIFFFSCVIAQSPECNPIECFYHVFTMFERDSSSGDPCFKIMRLEKCISQCSPSSENVILDGLLSMKLECAENPSEFISTKCENKHKFSLLSCMFRSLTLEPLNLSVNKSLLACRQASEGEKCDSQQLPSQCYPRTMTYKLTETFFRPLHRKNCLYYAMHEPYDIKVKPSKQFSNNKDFQELADCLDKSSYQVSDCIPDKWVMPNFLITAHFGNRLCKATEAFLFCLQNIVRTKCKRLEPTFNSITQSLYNYTLPKCFIKTGNTVSYKSITSVHNYDELSDDTAAGPLNVNETVDLHISDEESTFEDLNVTSTSGPSNKSGSEIFVIHQNVYVSLNYHDHIIYSAASCKVSCTNIFVSAVICLLYIYKHVLN